MKSIITFGLLLATSYLAMAQVAINADGASPDASAILDITSTDQGILIPRMDSLSRQSISDPANGLMVFDTSSNSFWYYTDSTWLNLNAVLSDADNDTKIQIEENPDEDIIRFDFGGTEFIRLDSGRIETYNMGNSVFIGEDAGQNDDYDNNVNVFMGYRAGQANTSGDRNVFMGAEAGDHNTSAGENTFIGFKAGYDNTTGSNNIFLGSRSGFTNTTGGDNTFLGHEAGYSNSTGSRNVFLGYEAGYNETGSDKLYIENSNASSPLIYGEFNNDLLQVNGTLSVTGGSSSTEYWRMENGRIEVLNTGNSVFIGDFAGQNDDFSNNLNVGIGYFALKSNTSGEANMAIGTSTLENCTGGDFNVAFGSYAGFNNTSGSSNVFVGNNAGTNITTGSGNVIIGSYAGGTSNVSQTLFIDNTDTNTPLIYGEFDNKLLTVNGTLEAKESITSDNDYVFTVENTANSNNSNNNGMLIKAGHDEFNQDEESSLIRFNTPNGTNLGRIRQESGSEIKLITSSDRRLKENILPTKYGLADILQIEVRDYNFITDADDHIKTGFIAQQLHTVFPTAVAVGDDAKTNPWGVDYAGLTPLLVKGMQDQQQLIDVQNELLQQQQQQINELQVRVDKITQLEQQNAEAKAMLEQIQQRLGHQ